MQHAFSFIFDFFNSSTLILDKGFAVSEDSSFFRRIIAILEAKKNRKGIADFPVHEKAKKEDRNSSWIKHNEHSRRTNELIRYRVFRVFCREF